MISVLPKALVGSSSLNEPPHFGGLWEAAVKSFKTHLSRIVGNTRLDFEEMTTILAQIVSCLNSRPLGTLPHTNEDSIEMLTPGHSLIPDDPQSFQEPA